MRLIFATALLCMSIERALSVGFDWVPMPISKREPNAFIPMLGKRDAAAAPMDALMNPFGKRDPLMNMFGKRGIPLLRFNDKRDAEASSFMWKRADWMRGKRSDWLRGKRDPLMNMFGKRGMTLEEELMRELGMMHQQGKRDPLMNMFGKRALLTPMRFYGKRDPMWNMFGKRDGYDMSMSHLLGKRDPLMNMFGKRALAAPMRMAALTNSLGTPAVWPHLDKRASFPLMAAM